MPLYVVTVPTTVETYAHNPHEAAKQAIQAIRSDSAVAAQVDYQHPRGRILVKLWRRARWSR